MENPISIGQRPAIKLLAIIYLSNTIQLIECKGGGGRGAAAAGAAVNSISDYSGSGSTTGNYTEEEMKVALIILSIILSIFFAILSCQCYSKVLYELIRTNPVQCRLHHSNEQLCQEAGCKINLVDAIPENEGKPLPCAPYSRQPSIVGGRSNSGQFVVIPNTFNHGICPTHLV